ncbi:MAG TPA: hypothetical protein VJB12_04970, partial [Candidatus Nanoarchaeia archaeon]|nr:hypothetical protein [Candidatus Nanoarchaeia archaeon]
MEKKCLVLTVFLIMLILVPSAFSLSLLNESDKGLFGATRGSDYDLILDSLFANAKVAVNTGGKLWVPWFKTSSGCAQTDLQSGANCNSGSAIDFTHNCMVSDEFSQVGIAVAMGKDQTRMDGFYNTVIASKSRNGNIPSWRIYRNGDAIEPCRSGINGNCDTASDATARIIIALYAGAKNQYFADSAKKGQYEQLARTLSADFLNYEVDRTCRPSSLGLGNICYWMAGGSEVKKAGISSNDYAYTGYFADGIIAMLQAYASTSDAKYLDVAKAFGLNYLQAANFNGNTFTVPPGKSFKWVPDSQGIPRAQCTNNCNPDTWDGFDATRAAGMCQANYYARQMGVVLPGMQKYCDLWGSKYMNDPNRAPVQYTASGGAMSYQHGYYAQGLQALFQSGGHNPSLFKPTVDSALSHFGAQSKTWDNAPCFGVYTTAFAIRALGMGIGRDLASFKSPVSSPAVPAPTAPSPIPAPTTGTNNPVIAFDDYYKINSTKSLYVNSRYLTWNDKGIDGGLKVIAVSKVSGAGF